MQKLKSRLLISAVLFFFPGFVACLLFPQDSEFRETKRLDGVWNFRISPSLDPELGFREKWFKAPLRNSPNADTEVSLLIM